jgi:hypothetical protein
LPRVAGDKPARAHQRSSEIGRQAIGSHQKAQFAVKPRVGCSALKLPDSVRDVPGNAFFVVRYVTIADKQRLLAKISAAASGWSCVTTAILSFGCKSKNGRVVSVLGGHDLHEILLAAKRAKSLKQRGIVNSAAAKSAQEIENMAFSTL